MGKDWAQLVLNKDELSQTWRALVAIVLDRLFHMSQISFELDLISALCLFTNDSGQDVAICIFQIIVRQIKLGHAGVDT